jgi:hypothetical protein
MNKIQGVEERKGRLKSETGWNESHVRPAQPTAALFLPHRSFCPSRSFEIVLALAVVRTWTATPFVPFNMWPSDAKQTADVFLLLSCSAE